MTAANCSPAVARRRAKYDLEKTQPLYFWYFQLTIQNIANRHVSSAFGLLAVFISLPLVRVASGFLSVLLPFFGSTTDKLRQLYRLRLVKILPRTSVKANPSSWCQEIRKLLGHEEIRENARRSLGSHLNSAGNLVYLRLRCSGEPQVEKKITIFFLSDFFSGNPRKKSRF